MKNLHQLSLLFLSSVSSFVPDFRYSPSRRSRSLFVVGKDKFDMEELRERIMKESNPYQNLFNNKEWEIRNRPNKVNIIFFRPETPDEGIHTIEFPKGSSNNIVLAFESMKECGSFAASLIAQGFLDPNPREVDLQSLESYCEQIGVFVQVVPRGTNVRPPKNNVEEFGINPNLKDQKAKLDYLFAMSNNELEENGALDLMEYSGTWD